MSTQATPFPSVAVASCISLTISTVFMVRSFADWLCRSANRKALERAAIQKKVPA